MRIRVVAAGCAAAAALGLLTLPSAARAASLPKPSISVTAKGSYLYQTNVKVTVTLHAALPDSTVSLYATPAGGKKTLVATGKVNADGKFYPVYRLGSTTTLTAVFSGNARNAATSVSRTVGSVAKVTDALKGGYKTVKISGTRYRVYHSTSTLTLTATVKPAKPGQCLEPETEQYNAGAGWGADTKYGCDQLNPTSHDTAPFTLVKAAGDRYRIRADYVRSSKDKSGLSGDAPWLYFEVVK